MLRNKKTIKSLRLKFTNSRGPFIPLYDYNKMFGCCHGSCHPPNQSQELPQGRATLLREELSQHGAYQYFHQRENWFSSKAITEITWFHLQLLHGALGSPPSYRLPLGWPQDLRLMGQVEKPFVSPRLGVLTLIGYSPRSLCLNLSPVLMECSSPAYFCQD